MWKCVSTGRASGRRPPPAAFQRERKHVCQRARVSLNFATAVQLSCSPRVLTRLCSKLQSRGGGQRPSGRARGGGREGTVTQRGPCPALPRPLGEQGAAGRPRAVQGDSPLSTPARRLPSLSSGSRFNGRRRVRTAQTCGVTRSVIVTALCSFLPLPIRVLLGLSRSPTSESHQAPYDFVFRSEAGSPAGSRSGTHVSIQ